MLRNFYELRDSYIINICKNFLSLIVLRVNYHLKIMNTMQTLEYIKKNKCSIARFGDGELSFTFNLFHEIAFQENSTELSIKLNQVLRNDSSNLLICIPIYFNSLFGCTKQCKKYWLDWGKRGNRQKHIVKSLRVNLGRNYIYGDSLISRPYMDRQNLRYAERVFKKFKSLWENRDLLIVEGSQTRLGVGNDLFSNANSVKRILTPAKNAFECYNQIQKVTLEEYNGELILLALGPTATILASDLSYLNIQAIDIGHIDIEYEWFLRKQKVKTPISGKFTNECVDGREYSLCNDKKYLSEIVRTINVEKY